MCWLERQSDCSLDCDDPLFGDYHCAGTWSALLRVFSGLQAELGHILTQFPKNLRPWLCLVSSFGRSAKKTAGNLIKKRLTWLADRILTRTLKNFLIFPIFWSSNLDQVKVSVWSHLLPLLQRRSNFRKAWNGSLWKLWFVLETSLGWIETKSKLWKSQKLQKRYHARSWLVLLSVFNMMSPASSRYIHFWFTGPLWNVKISLILVEIFLVSAVSGFDARGARAALPKKRAWGCWIACWLRPKFLVRQVWCSYGSYGIVWLEMKQKTFFHIFILFFSDSDFMKLLANVAMIALACHSDFNGFNSFNMPLEHILG